MVGSCLGSSACFSDGRPRPPAPFMHHPDPDAGSLVWLYAHVVCRLATPYTRASALRFLSCNVSFYIWLPNSSCHTVKNYKEER